jgi:hypothetical protein
MKTFAKVTVAMLVLASLGLESCKKGEGDPFLSLRSRKGRVAGEWKVTAGKGSSVSSASSTTWTYDGATESSTEVIGTSSTTDTDTYTKEYTFEKDGTYTSSHIETVGTTTITTTTKGNWNFEGGVGEVKNKSQIVMVTTEYTESNGTTTNTTSYTGSTPFNTEVWDVYQLKSKEMIVKSKTSMTSGTNTSTTESEWTLTAK